MTHAPAIPWIRVSQAALHSGEPVEIRGWIYNKRSSGKLQFLLVRDGSGLIQCVMPKAEVPVEAWALAETVPQESAVIVRGTVRADARAPGGAELGVTDLSVIQRAEPYPITPKEHGVEFLMDHRHLWLRSSRQRAIMQVRAELIRTFRDFMDGE